MCVCALNKKKIKTKRRVRFCSLCVVSCATHEHTPQRCPTTSQPVNSRALLRDSFGPFWSLQRALQQTSTVVWFYLVAGKACNHIRRVPSRLVVVAAIASAAAHTSAGGWLIEVRALQAERKNYFFFNEYSWIFGQNKPKVRKRKATFRLQCVAHSNCLFIRAAFRLWYNIFALAKKFTFHVVSH